MMKIGLTGNIGSGKDTIAKLLSKKNGFLESNSDDICRWLWDNDFDIQLAISGLFCGATDIATISKLAFDNKKKRKKLEEIFHPRIKEMHDFVYLKEKDNNDFLIVNSPLLVESGLYKEMDYNVVVNTNRNICIERVLYRNPHLSKEDIGKRFDAQMNFNEKMEFLQTCYVINNNYDVNNVKRQVEDLYEVLLTMKGD